jgi:hypothetical protein
MNRSHFWTIVLVAALSALCLSCSDRGTADAEFELNDEEQVVKAVQEGRTGAVKDAIQKNPDLLTWTDFEGKTLLHHAAAFSATDVAKVLIDAGADPNVRDNDGQSVQDVADEWRANREFQKLMRDAGAL